MKYRCFKAECPICHQPGSIQLFINNKQEVRYARTKHTNLNKQTKKQVFIYCKINDKEALKTLLSKQNNILTTSTTLGQKGQTIRFETIDPKHGNCATKKQNKHWTGSSVRIEHQPPKLGVEGSNPSPPATNNPLPFLVYFLHQGVICACGKVCCR